MSGLDPFSPELRRPPSGRRVDFGIDTDEIQNLSVVPGASVSDALDVVYNRRVNYLDVSLNPTLLWNFQDTLAAVRGPNFVTTSGPYSFTDVTPGVRGMFVGTGTIITAAASASAVLLGDVTVMALMQLDSNPSNLWIAGCAGAANLDPTHNASWALVLPDTTPPRRIQGYWENGSNAAQGFLTSSASGSPSVPPVHNVMQIGFSRSGTTGVPYLNGNAFGPSVSGGSAPTNGSAGVVTLGARVGNTSPDQFLILSLGVWNRALSAAEWKAAYNQSLGNGLGFLT